MPAAADAMPNPAALTHADHVPDGWCYGPVRSRRFGRSLGVSCSAADVWSCTWRCPYCQQGGHPRRPGQGHGAVDEILAALAGRLATVGHDLDAITVAGSGEPTDHPEFATIAAGVCAQARSSALRSVLLTNGEHLDGAQTPAWYGAFDAVYVKWDPGAQGGCWPGVSQRRAQARRDRLAGLSGLRVQALGFDARHVIDDATRLAAWLDDLTALAPVEVHLTTIERQPATAGLRAWDASRLERWAQAAQWRLGVPVRAFPAREGGSHG